MAARGVNKVIIVGNLGNDPEIRYTQDSTAIANISVATSESWKDKTTGEQKEITEWHRCVAYRRLAEIMGEYLKKGSKVYIEGRLQTRKWQDSDGNDKYTTEIIVNEMQMLDSRGDSGQQAGSYQPQPQQQAAPQQQNQQQRPNSNQPPQGQRPPAPNPPPQQQRQQQNAPQQGNQDYADDIPF